MNEESRRIMPMRCEEMERLLPFYLCDEVEDAEKEAVERHLEVCSACAAALQREQRLLEAVAAAAPQHDLLNREDPAALLLERCRRDLSEALDRAGPAGGWRRWVAALSPSNWAGGSRAWVAAHPVWSAAGFLLVGIGLGQGIPRWIAPQLSLVSGEPTMIVSAPPALNQNLRSASAVNFLPASSGDEAPRVEIRGTSEENVLLEGTLDRSDVKEALLYLVENSQQFDSGVRLDSMEALRTRGDDTEVRQVLCKVARQDRNVSVRLKAIETLRGFEQEDRVREVLLDAVQHDSNAGVRIAAINALRAMAENQDALPRLRNDERAVRVLNDLMRNDSNNYIRWQSAAAMRQIAPRQTF